MTIAIILLVVAGAALLWGNIQRTSLGAFRPAASAISQLPDSADVLERIAAALPALPAARLIERDAQYLLVSAGPSPRCLSRGGGIFLRISRTAAGVQVEGRAKVPLNTKAAAAVTEFERQMRQAVQASWP